MQDETSRLRAVGLGVAQQNGPVPDIKDTYMMQTTNNLLMVRPLSFRKNEQTAVNNLYQKELSKLSHIEIHERALAEFDALVQQLKRVGIRVLVLQDTEKPTAPAGIFSNNWVSFHEDGTVGLYPIFAPNNRLERTEDLFEFLEASGFEIAGFVDYTSAAEQGYFLEGTASMVLDRVHRKAYCALSARTDEELFIESLQHSIRWKGAEFPETTPTWCSVWGLILLCCVWKASTINRNAKPFCNTSKKMEKNCC